VSALDAKIDDLYRLPLAEFTTARNALAKSLPKDDAKVVKALEKPTVVPWTVNQVYWRARSTYDRLMKSGENLRAVQIAALEGRAADVRAASEAHRRAISDAVAEGERLAAAVGVKPGADALARTFESLSLATNATHTPGRLTAVMQPAGFEALLGVTPSDVRSTKSEVRKPQLVRSAAAPRTTHAEPRTKNDDRRAKEADRLAKAAAAAAERQAAKEAAEKQKHEAAVKAAEQQLERMQAAEQAARETWERAHDELLAARQALTDVRRSRFRSP
jgi:flagellar biosynthesis GTPase FlhF